MTALVYFAIVTITALSLAGFALQGWTPLRGEQRSAYLGALVLLGVAGGVIAWGLVPLPVPGEPAVPPTPVIVLGSMCGIGCVALGRPILDLVGLVIPSLGRWFARRFGGDK